MSSSIVSAGVSNLPPITKLGLVLVPLLSALRWVLDQGFEFGLSYYVTMVPGRAMWCFWTFVSANLVEVDVFSFVLNLLAFLLCGRYLERVWGSREFLKFCSLTGCLSMFSVFAFFICAFAATDDLRHLYGNRANGLAGILCGFTVAFKQLVPEHTVEFMKGAVGIRVKYFPLINICIRFIWGIVTRRPTQPILSVTGLLVGWFYLRFVKIQNGIRGDRSETFSFASFYPDALQPPVMVASNIAFNLMVFLRLLRPNPTTAGAPFDLEGGLSMRPHVRQPLPGSDHSEAERRRALALRQLDMRLATSTSPTSAAPPSSAIPNSPTTKKTTVPSSANLLRPTTKTHPTIPSESNPTPGEPAAPEVFAEEEKKSGALAASEKKGSSSSRIPTNEDKDTS